MRITSRQLRQIIREELIREVENPGSAMSVTTQKGKINTAISELTKTHSWFKDTVFPAIEDNAWPIVADQDYTVAFSQGVYDKAGTGVVPMNDRSFVKKGARFPNINGKTVLAFGSGQTDNRSVNLSEIYEMLESHVIYRKLPIPMESFPG